MQGVNDERRQRQKNDRRSRGNLDQHDGFFSEQLWILETLVLWCWVSHQYYRGSEPFSQTNLLHCKLDSLGHLTTVTVCKLLSTGFKQGAAANGRVRQALLAYNACLNVKRTHIHTHQHTRTHTLKTHTHRTHKHTHIHTHQHTHTHTH